MKNLTLLFLLISFGCSSSSNSNNSFQFTSIECSPEEMPKFDGNKVTFLDDNQNPIKDTIISTVEKRRTVFKPCRELTYNAVYKSKNGDLITESRIKLMALGKRWEHQPEKQDEIVVQYEFTNDDFERNKKYQLNKKLQSIQWMGQGTEGVIENVEEIWMHPLRSNQFNFTEVAPFPEIKFPLRIDKSWSGGLSIQQGWGDWENSSGNFQYKVVAKENIKTKYGQIDDCWKIESQATYQFGKSYFDYWFNEDLGFIKMEYKNYGNQTLSIELAEVKDNSI